jgi:hypothetical protein
LNWRYIDFPFGERTVYTIEGSDNALHGYVVIQKEKTTNGIISANILELFTKRNDAEAMFSLLNVVREYAKKNGCAIIEMIPCNEMLAKAAGSYGFIRRKLPVPVCIYKVNDNVSRDMPDTTEGWFMSSGDGDTSVYSAQ